jgi:hypothetical protein
MAVYILNGHKIYQHFPFQGPPKFTKIGIFGLKINHLATLVIIVRNNILGLRVADLVRLGSSVIK